MQVKILARCLAIGISILIATTAEAQNCKDFMVLDLYSSSDDYSSYERIKDVACKREVRDAGSAQQSGVQAGIPLPVLKDVFDLKFGASTSASDWSHWQSEFCNSHFDEQRTNLTNSKISQTFSENAKEVVKECLNSQAPVYGYFEIPKSGESFKFSFRVLGKEKLREATVAPADAVKDCDPTNPFGMSLLYKYFFDLDISGQKKEFGCTWKDRSKPITLTIKLVTQGDFVPLLDSIPRRAPPQPGVYKWVKQEAANKVVTFGECLDKNYCATVVDCNQTNLGQEIYAADNAEYKNLPPYQGFNVVLEAENSRARICGQGACGYDRSPIVSAEVYKCSDTSKKK